MIEDVIAGVRESFIDEGVDEQVLLELKQIWETKLMSSKAVELNPEPPEPQVPQLNTHKSVPGNKGMYVISVKYSFFYMTILAKKITFKICLIRLYLLENFNCFLYLCL